MFELTNMLLLALLLIVLTSLTLLFFTKTTTKTSTKSKSIDINKWPKPHPIFGHLLAFAGLTQEEIYQWMSNILATSPSSTTDVYVFRHRSVFTGDPAIVEHIVKTKLSIYEKGPMHKLVFSDLFGDSLFTINGDAWKAQRLFVNQEFTNIKLHNFVQSVLNFEISERLIPFLYDAAKNNKVVDLQDILQRFTFENVCRISFGYDPGYLLPSLPETKIADAFDESLTLCHNRFHALFPILWKACRFLNIGSEKKLKHSIRTLRKFAKTLIDSRKQEMKTEDQEKNDLLSRLLQRSDLFTEKDTIDAIIAFILAGLDTSSAALTWFFWLLHKNRHVEQEILNEIKSNNNINKTSFVFEELKGMPYIQAALAEAMRLYSPAPAETKQVSCDDVLPDGTKVQKDMIVGFFPYSMGRSEKIWGKDWAEFRPERWLREETDSTTGKTKRGFVPRDSYSYTVFMAGPRICPGKEMAFLQMKAAVSAVLSRFTIVPAVDNGFEPIYVPATAAKMKGGLPVRIQERVLVDPSKIS